MQPSILSWLNFAAKTFGTIIYSHVSQRIYNKKKVWPNVEGIPLVHLGSDMICRRWYKCCLVHHFTHNAPLCNTLDLLSHIVYICLKLDTETYRTSTVHCGMTSCCETKATMLMIALPLFMISECQNHCTAYDSLHACKWYPSSALDTNGSAVCMFVNTTHDAFCPFSHYLFIVTYLI